MSNEIANRPGRGYGRIFLRGKTWWIAYYAPQEDGTAAEIRESAKSESEDAARDLLSKRIQAVRNDRDGIQTFQGPSAERLTVAELLDALELDFQTRGIKGLRIARVQMNPVREALGKMRAIRLTTDRVRQYIDDRRTAGKAPATINRETGLLRQAYRLARDEHRFTLDLKVPQLPERNARVGFFEKADLEALLPLLPAPIDAVTRFGYMTGWRRGEILGLTWENVDREAGEIRLTDSKNGEGRLLPLDGPLAELLEAQWRAREFTRRDGSSGLSTFVFHRNGKRIDSATFGRQWRTACEDAKLPGKLFHDLRRSAVRGMIRAGVSQTVAMTISGHRTVSVFQRYNITSTGDQLEALRLRQEREEAAPSTSNVRQMREAGKETS